MASKGNKRHILRLASSKYMKLARKSAPYVMKPKPGRHTIDSSIAISTVLREKLAVAQDLREAELMLRAGSVKVNGKVIKSASYPVGFGDSIELVPSKEHYHISVMKEGAFALEKGKEHQHFKIVGKYVTKGSKLMIRLHDGTILPGSKEMRVGDTVSMKAGKPDQVLHMENGKKCFVMKGTHASESGVIKQINPGTSQKSALVKIEGSSGEFETLLDNIMVVG